MDARKGLIALVCLMAGAGLVCAESEMLDIVDVEIDLDDSGDAFVVCSLFFNSTGKETVSFPVPNAEFARVYDLEGDLLYDIADGVLTFAPREESLGYLSTVEYFTSYSTAKVGSNWSFSLSFSPDYEVRDLIFALYLPENSSLVAHSPAGTVSTRDGALAIEWYFGGLEAGDNTQLSAEYVLGAIPQPPVEEPGENESGEPPEEEPTPEPDEEARETAGTATGKIPNFSDITLALLVIFFLLLAFVVGSHFFDSREPKKKKLSKGQRDVLSTLTGEEQLIVREIVCAGGEETQADIYRNTGISKATLSRRARDLQNKKVIDIRDLGHKNLLVLTEWFREL